MIKCCLKDNSLYTSHKKHLQVQ